MSGADALLQALEGTQAIVGMFDPADRLVYANQAYRDTFLPGHDGSPIHFADILRYGFQHKCGVRIDSGDIEAFLKAILPRRRATPHRIIQTDTLDGRWINITETLLPDGCLLSIGSDITDLKRSEKSLRREHERTVQMAQELRRTAEELARSNAELEQFAAVASHDLQEPLRTVASFTQLLAGKRGQSDPAAAAQYREFVVAGVRRMQALIADLLAYSRASTRSAALAPTPLADMLATALLNLEGTLQARNACVSHDELPVVMAQGAQIAQVLQNLIANAIKFSKEAPRVHLSAERRGQQWAIAVRDNGIGIEAQHFGKLFMIFQRLHARDAYEGTGVGLAICKKIVERHGGRIWAESPGLDRGATFWFTLPAAR